MRVLLLFVLVTLTAPTSHGSACWNEYVRIYVLPQATRQVERVERLMAQGNTRRAYRIAAELREAVVGADALDRRHSEMSRGWYAELEGSAIAETIHPEQAQALERRVALLHAILVVRLDGQITRRRRVARHVQANVRDMHLRAARSVLVTRVAASAEDPRTLAYHAESLLGDDAHRAEAIATLRDLAARDLIGDPLTWVALAAVETDEAQEAALARCQAMLSRRANRICVVR